MATLTLRNVPDDVHKRLKADAARNGRSLNQEAISQLWASFSVSPPVERPADDRVATDTAGQPVVWADGEG